ncbi:MAG TPA: DUF4142 domain-containing protein [Stellaceae bacterium]|nr:DUF4142 domain-containing protein [Stellaceae bacterium]
MKLSLALTAALLALVLPAGFAHAASATAPKDFVTTAIKGDISEVKIGQLAEQQGSTAAVRDFGKTLVTDHTNAEDQAKTTAKQINVTPPDQPTAEAQDEYDKLAKLKGTAFDNEFAQYMVKDHQQDIATFKDEAAAKNGPASTLAEQQLPVLQKHLQMAQSIASKQQAKTP